MSQTLPILHTLTHVLWGWKLSVAATCFLFYGTMCSCIAAILHISPPMQCPLCSYVSTKLKRPNYNPRPDCAATLSGNHLGGPNCAAPPANRKSPIFSTILRSTHVQRCMLLSHHVLHATITLGGGFSSTPMSSTRPPDYPPRFPPPPFPPQFLPITWMLGLHFVCIPKLCVILRIQWVCNPYMDQTQLFPKCTSIFIHAGFKN